MLRTNQRRRIVAALTIFIMVFSGVLTFQYSKTLAYNEKSGTVNGTYVNVRTGPGTSNAKLTYGGKNVQLNVGDSVTVIDEATASDGSLWYKIKFNYNGQIELTGYMHSEYVDVDENIYSSDADFEAYLELQGFPESYKVKLRNLHAKYPNWVFVADHLSYDWNDAVKNESVIGRSLIHKSSISSWKSLATGSYNWETGQWATFDGGSWVAASEELVAYCMDPRNFLDETYIFQFELLSFNASIHKEDNVEKLLSGSFMSNAYAISGKTYAATFMDAAAQSGVSPYHLVSRVLQEVGSQGTSGSVSGYYAPSTGNVYRNLYNFYNIGAYAANGRGAVENGLIYASQSNSTYLRPWDTRYKAIVGGAIFIGSGYINIGQDTIYYEKFDFVGTPYTHQFMTNVLAPKSEASKMAKAYSDSMKKSISLVFKIPVFQNMPSEASPCPTSDGSPNNILESLTVNGYNLTPTFNKFTQSYDLIVPNSVGSIRISATALDENATISGTGNIALNVGNNTINIVVTAKNGDTRTYTINAVRSAPSSGNTNPEPEPPTTQEPTTTPPTTNNESSYSTSYKQLNNEYLAGIAIGTSTDTIKASFSLKNCSVSMYKSDGVTEYSGTVGTGSRVRIKDSSGNVIKEYVCLIYGDINGDGNADLVDMLYQKRHILGISALTGVKSMAADINQKGGIDLVDMLYVKRQILGIASIPQ